MATASEFISAAALALAREALQRAKGVVGSRTLARSMQVIADAPGRARVSVPQYWAAYYHDGRGPIRAKPGHYLVWFKNPAEDPRAPNGNYPTRSSQIRRLTKAEFYRALRLNQIIVTRRAGPAPAHKFFESAAVRGTLRFASSRIPAAFSRHVREALRDVLNVRGVISL